MHYFQLNRGNLIRSSVFRNANPVEFERISSWKVIRITCSIRQDQTWRSKNFMLNLSMSASVNYKRQTEAQKIGITGRAIRICLKLDENELDYKKNCP